LPADILRVLLIKTSSMGDLVHTLSAVQEAHNYLPQLQIDWVCEEAFVDLPVLSKAVHRVIPVALRRWKKNWWSAVHRQERAAFKDDLQRQTYDLVIDAQGLIKSAWILRMARVQPQGRWGYDWSSAREPLASLVVDHKVNAPQHLHAIERLRLLFSQALNYSPQGGPSTLDLMGRKAVSVPSPFIFFLHGTSRSEKEWPVQNWIELGRQCTAAGFHVALPWGSPIEQQKAQQIAAGIQEGVTEEITAGSAKGAAVPAAAPSRAQAVVLPRLAIAELIDLLNHAAGAVGVDSGLMHLSAAAAKPTVAIMAAAHLPHFAATRFAPFWAPHARVLATQEDHRQITVDQVFCAWSELMGVAR
jgi:heptosyltransferase I